MVVLLCRQEIVCRCTDYTAETPCRQSRPDALKWEILSPLADLGPSNSGEDKALELFGASSEMRYNSGAVE
jgi:hypothetical protein